uniref:Uncharacterized protein n=1 Tax=Arundo donax TaxID=35708 RepID=A0A0A9DWV0_ARUDO
MTFSSLIDCVEFPYLCSFSNYIIHHVESGIRLFKSPVQRNLS